MKYEILVSSSLEEDLDSFLRGTENSFEDLAVAKTLARNFLEWYGRVKQHAASVRVISVHAVFASEPAYITKERPL